MIFEQLICPRFSFLKQVSDPAALQLSVPEGRKEKVFPAKLDSPI